MAGPVKKSAGGKKITGTVTLQLQAGKASPAPPVGTVLGPRGVNIMEFCNAFNKQTKDLEQAPYPVLITIYSDRSFTFVIKKPPMTYLLKKKAGITAGSKNTGKRDGQIGEITWADALEIARFKIVDMACVDEMAAARCVVGSAKSMGIRVTGMVENF